MTSEQVLGLLAPLTLSGFNLTVLRESEEESSQNPDWTDNDKRPTCLSAQGVYSDESPFSILDRLSTNMELRYQREISV